MRYQRAATLLVCDMDTAVVAVEANGGMVIEGPPTPPAGPMIARHGDGAVFEYIQPPPT